MAVILIFLLVALAWVIYKAPTVAVVAIGGMTLAIVLSFPVRVLSRLMPRNLAILATFLLLIGLFAFALFLLIPVLSEQLRALVTQAPEIEASAKQFFFHNIRPLYERKLPGGTTPKELLSGSTKNITGRLQGVVQNLLGGLTGFVSGLLSAGVTLFGVLFVAVYLLIDVRKIKTVYLKIVPRSYRRDAWELWEDFGISLSRYLGGLLFVIGTEGVLAGLGMWILGVPFPAVLGAWISITAIIPYVGAILGGIPAFFLALMQSPTTALLVCIVYALIQQLESHILTPRIQGQALRIHPILVLLGVIAGGEIGGFLGVLFSIPLLAVLRVLFDFFWARLRTENPAEVRKRTTPNP